MPEMASLQHSLQKLQESEERLYLLTGARYIEAP